MKTIYQTTLVILLVVLLTGCTNPLSKVGEKAVRQNAKNWTVLGNRQIKYIEKDTRLNEDDKKDRKLAVKKAQNLAKKMEVQFK